MNRRAARTNPLLHPLRAHWHKLAAREQNLILLATALAALTLLWSLALAPALRSLRTAPERHAQAEQQLRRMLLLQAEAEQLRNITRPAPGDVRTLLQSALAQELGNTAQLQWTGDGSARITLAGAAAPALARWLARSARNCPKALRPASNTSPVSACKMRTRAPASWQAAAKPSPRTCARKSSATPLST